MNLKGQLGKDDIQNELKNGNLKIIPCNDECIKGASYDLTPSAVAMSTKKGMLEKVYREKCYLKDKYYIYAHPKDTVLIVSNEYIQLQGNIAGYISSRVSKLVEGFGHISTTIDPNWAGAVLIAVSNPTSKPLKIYVGRGYDPNNRINSLATVTLHYLNTPVGYDDEPGKIISDVTYKGMRLDLLENISYKNRWGIRAWGNWFMLVRRRKYTDYFLEKSKELEKAFTADKWESFINEFSDMDETIPVQNENRSEKAKKRARDFCVVETWFTNIWYAYKKHTLGVQIAFTAFLYLAFRFNWFSHLPEEILQDVRHLVEVIFPIIGELLDW